MYQLIYVSSAVNPFTTSELADLLAKARVVNSHHQVTGALLYEDGNFFQVLEGPQKGVETIYAKICQDRRHRGIVKMVAGPIPERDFPDWTMGWLRRDGLPVPVPAWRDWNAMRELVRAGRARTLLGVFAESHRQK